MTNAMTNCLDSVERDRAKYLRHPITLQPGLTIDSQQLMTLCDHWQITEVALFGSILGDRFRPDSDVDLLVSFSPTAKITLLDLHTIECEFSRLFQNRSIDLVTRRAIEQSHNPIRRNNILGNAQVIYQIDPQAAATP